MNWSIDSDVSGMTVRLVTERNFVCYGFYYNGSSPVWQRFVNAAPGELVELPVPASIWRGRRSGSFRFYLWNSSYSNAVYKSIRFVITTAETPTPSTTVNLRESGKTALAEEGNRKLSEMAKEETTAALNKVLRIASERMKNGYNLADN